MKKDKININICCSSNAPLNIRVKCASEIFEQYGEFLRAMVYINISDKSLVEDIMQDFFVSLVEHPVREGIEDIKSYLYKAIVNDIIDKIRRINYYQEKVQRYRRVADNNRIKQKITFEETLLEREEIIKLFKKIEKNLPQKEAAAVLNYCTFQYDIATAAERMQVDTRTFSRYVCVGLKKLRQLLQWSDGEDI